MIAFGVCSVVECAEPVCLFGGLVLLGLWDPPAGGGEEGKREKELEALLFVLGGEEVEEKFKDRVPEVEWVVVYLTRKGKLTSAHSPVRRTLSLRRRGDRHIRQTFGGRQELRYTRQTPLA